MWAERSAAPAKEFELRRSKRSSTIPTSQPGTPRRDECANCRIRTAVVPSSEGKRRLYRRREWKVTRPAQCSTPTESTGLDQRIAMGPYRHEFHSDPHQL